MTPCFRGKAEEEEEDYGTSWGGPTSKLETNDDAMIHPPDYRRNLLNTGEVVVSLLPADPWFHGLRGQVDSHEEDCQRRRTHHLHTGHGHETEVSAWGQRAIRAQELGKLSLAHEEGTQCKDWKGGGGQGESTGRRKTETYCSRPSRSNREELATY